MRRKRRLLKLGLGVVSLWEVQACKNLTVGVIYQFASLTSRKSNHHLVIHLVIL